MVVSFVVFSAYSFFGKLAHVGHWCESGLYLGTDFVEVGHWWTRGRTVPVYTRVRWC